MEFKRLPELVENKPVPKLRLIQHGVEVISQIRIKLVSHLNLIGLAP